MWDITLTIRITLTVVLACVASLMIVLVAVSFRRKEQKRLYERTQLPQPESAATRETKTMNSISPQTYS